MRKPLFAACLFVALVCSAGFADDRFAEANKLYEARAYDSAAVAYQSILADGIESSSLYFNLANAQFKAGKLGQAIANYLRAQRLDPTDEDIIANLALAKSFAPVQVEGGSLNPVSSTLQSLLGPLPLHRLAWWSSILFVSSLVLLFGRFVLQWRMLWLRPALLTTTLLCAVAALATTWKYRSEFVLPRGVVVAAQSQVYTGPTTHSEVELQAAQGMVVEIVDQSGEFYNVRFENMRRGWVAVADIEQI